MIARGASLRQVSEVNAASAARRQKKTCPVTPCTAASVVLGANRYAMSEGRKQVTKSDVDLAVQDFVPSAQGLERDVARVRQSFEDLSEQEATGQFSGLAGRGSLTPGS